MSTSETPQRSQPQPEERQEPEKRPRPPKDPPKERLPMIDPRKKFAARRPRTKNTHPRATLVGVGTHGLGNRCQNAIAEMSRNECMHWAEKKREDRSVPREQMTERLGYIQQRDNEIRQHQQRKMQHDQEVKANAAVVQSENKQLRAALRQFREEELARLRQFAKEIREGMARDDEIFRQAESDGGNTQRSKKCEDAVSTEQWKARLQEERRASKARVEQFKFQWLESHERALKERAAQQKEKLEEIQQTKVKARERKDRWKDEVKYENDKLRQETAENRQNWNISLQTARRQFEEDAKASVATMRKTFDELKSLTDQRRNQHAKEKKDEVAARKKERAVAFADRLAELSEERHKAALQLREQSAILAAEKQNDKEAYINATKERRRAFKLPPVERRNDDSVVECAA